MHDGPGTARDGMTFEHPIFRDSRLSQFISQEFKSRSVPFPQSGSARREIKCGSYPLLSFHEVICEYFIKVPTEHVPKYARLYLFIKEGEKVMLIRIFRFDIANQWSFMRQIKLFSRCAPMLQFSTCWMSVFRYSFRDLSTIKSMFRLLIFWRWDIRRDLTNEPFIHRHIRIFNNCVQV